MDTEQTRASADSPRASFEYIKTTLQNRRNYLRAYEELFEKFGDAVSERYFFDRWLFFHPDHVQRIFKENGSNYTKSPDFNELRPLFGSGLFTSEGRQWTRDRRIVAPEFHMEGLKKFAQITIDSVNDLVRTWETESAGRTDRELSAEMSTLTFTVIGKALFGKELKNIGDVVAHSILVAQDTAIRRLMSPIKIPYFIPTRRHRSTLRALRTLDRIVFEMLDENPERESEPENLLTRLLLSHDPESGEGLSRTEIRDQLMTLMIAGHETTSNALAWTFYLLGRHPEVLGRLQEEVGNVLRGALPAFDDVKKLSYTKMVLEEAMRLYPPVPGISRTAIQNDLIGGYRIKSGAIVEVSQWITHRHPEFWIEPLKFEPERFLPESVKAMHPFAYFPFGGGMRACIGKHFALTEAVLILAVLVQKFEFELSRHDDVVPEPLLTLRPRGGVWVRIRPRRERASTRSKEL